MKTTMEFNKVVTHANKRRWVILIFIIAIGLRIVLGILNREANDNHVDVVNLILSTGKLPGKSDCWSCYQPKLYYLFCAGLIKSIGVQEVYLRIKVMQLVNVFTSIFILLIFWKFIDSLILPTGKKVIAFAFFAFNPCLIGINIQSTNDTWAIFFGILSTYAAVHFFREMKLSRMTFLIVALIAGTLSKASVAVLAVAISMGLVGKIILESDARQKKAAAGFLFILIVGFMAVVPYAGGYYRNYEQYNSFTLSTWEKDPPPKFFEITWVVRSGLRSMFEGYFTFRYFDMLRQPYINNDWNNYPMHRTSLWSQLYGRTLFLHFDQWPPGWQSQSAFIVDIGRGLIFLGVIPLILFAAGIFVNLGEVAKKALRIDKAYFAQPLNYLFTLIALAYLASSMFYSYTYRDFSSMKSIYIFPGLIGFIKMFADGYSLLGKARASVFINSALILMVLLSIVDVGFLIYQIH